MNQKVTCNRPCFQLLSQRQGIGRDDPGRAREKHQAER